jgi:asparagine synthase (glutamine-hydrolysing)
MCGICGVIGLQDSGEAESIVRRMMAAMPHRGPDDEGLLVVPSVAVGMRRLSIIDLPGGRQPVCNEDGTLAVILNGEIYNFQELRRTLEAKGHSFRTHSDTEVVVHAYETWGQDCVHHLRGMFALAVLEGSGSSSLPPRLFLARDRMGIKPLYYAITDGVFLFASEVRSLLASGRVARRLSPEALHSYLLFGSVGEPTTLVEGVASLLPGHRLLLDPGAKPLQIRPEPYWTLSRQAASPRSAPAENAGRASAAGRLRTQLEDSVRLHLIADVPLGVFLSSGLDSTVLVALASRETSKLHTFTVVFPELEFSEAEPARITARHFGTNHDEMLLRGEEMLSHLDDAVAALDQPSMDGINTFYVSWAARRAGIKVALSGLGGDEIFGGYDTFRSAPQLNRLGALGRKIPRPVRSLTSAGVALFAGQRSPDAARKLAALWRSPESLPHPYFFSRLLFDPEQAGALLRSSRLQPNGSAWWRWLVGAAEQAREMDDFNRVFWLESRSYMLNVLLRDTDGMSMAHSLEVRVPFLDHSVVELVGQLPGKWKRRGNAPKALLVDAVGDLLPAQVLGQRKRPFTLPWERWLRGPLRQRMAGGLANLTPALSAALNPYAVFFVWRAYLAGRTGWSRPWSLYVLNEWTKRHLEGSQGSG